MTRTAKATTAIVVLLAVIALGFVIGFGIELDGVTPVALEMLFV